MWGFFYENYFGFIRVRWFGVDFVVVFDVLESVIY